MFDFRTKYSALGDAMRDYDQGEALLAEKEKELELMADTIENIKADQVEKMKKVWDAEDALHALMPKDYRRVEEPTKLTNWGLAPGDSNPTTGRY
jgi:hypothetical protein